MSVSLDTLLTAQKDKAQNLVGRLDQAVSSVGQRKEEFSSYFDERVEGAERAAAEYKEAFKEAPAYEPKKLDDYRKDAQREYQDFSDDVASTAKNVYKESKSEVSEAGAAASEVVANKAPVKESSEKAVEQTASDVAATIEAEKARPEQVATQTAEVRGLEAILNVAATGSAEGEAVQTSNVEVGKILARGEKIIQSQQEAGALILNQQGGSLDASQLTAGKGENVAQGQGSAQTGGAAQLTNIAAVAESLEGKAAQAQTVSVGVEKTAKSAVNVARQSKLLVQQAVQAAKQQVDVSQQPVVEQSKAANSVAQMQQPAQQNIAQVADMLAKPELLKQVQKQASGVQQQAEVSADKNVNTAAVVGNVAAQRGAASNSQMMNGQQKQMQANAAMQKAGESMLNDKALDADNLLAAKPSDSTVKPEMSQNIDGSKFKEYMKVVDVQNSARTQTQQGAAKSESVIAQIKFGMAAAAAKGDKQVTIQLYPKELGTVDVHMKISASKGAEITMVAEKSETASMLQREAQSLKEALNDALKNQNTQLNFAFRENDQGQSQQKQNNGFAMNGNDYGMLEGKEEEIIPLHHMKLGMETGVDLVI